MSGRRANTEARGAGTVGDAACVRSRRQQTLKSEVAFFLLCHRSSTTELYARPFLLFLSRPGLAKLSRLGLNFPIFCLS